MATESGEAAETDMLRARLPRHMADLIVYGILAVILLVIFFGYLMLRRAAAGFREGFDQGQRDR